MWLGLEPPRVSLCGWDWSKHRVSLWGWNFSHDTAQLWELACLRKRCVRHLMHQLTYRFRGLAGARRLPQESACVWGDSALIQRPMHGSKSGHPNVGECSSNVRVYAACG